MSNRNTESRRVSSAGTVQLPARPGGAQVAPPGGGGGDTPAASGSGKLPGVRGPGPQSFSAAQESAPASAATKKVLPNGIIEVPSWLEVKVDRRGIIYRVVGRDNAIKLIANILFIATKSSKGSIIRLSNKKMTSLLGLEGYFDATTIGLISWLLNELGITESYKARKRIYFVVNMNTAVIKEIKNAKTIEETVEVVRKYLSG
jgi:hypothetical protein